MWIVELVLLSTILAIVAFILREVRKMALTMPELEQELNKVSAQVTKIGMETTQTLELVKKLEEELANAGGTTPAVDAALATLKAQVEKVDAMVADTTPSPT